MARRQKGSPASAAEPIVRARIWPSPSRTITKTPSRVSRSTSPALRDWPVSTVRATPSALSRTACSTPESRALKTVRRHLMGILPLPQRVPRAPDRPDQGRLPRTVDLSAHVPYVDVYDVCLDARILSPDPAQQQPAREYPPGVAGHELQQVVLPGGQIYAPLATPDLAARRVDLQVGHPEHLVALNSPEHGPEAREELLNAEGLGEVVVGAQPEAVDLVGDRVAGREHDDGNHVPPLAQPLQDPYPVESRQHDVEDDDRGLELC